MPKSRANVRAFLHQICQESAFIKGKYLQTFEQQFIKACRAEYGAGCSNGTSALKLALETYGIGIGDEVIIPSHTFVATAEAVCHVGATPVFADIKAGDYTIDCDSVARSITKRTKAIIAVHLYGTPCDMDRLMELCTTHQLLLFEDCAQAHLAEFRGQTIGTFGAGASFSFYPGKNLGAYGDAGFVLVQHPEKAELLKRFIDHGRLGKFDHEICGYNERMDAMQAGILSIKLKYLNGWNHQRRAIAQKYHDYFQSHKNIKTMVIDAHKQPVYHVYCIEVPMRAEIIAALNNAQIQHGIHYPTPVHQLKPFLNMPRDALPVSESISPRILSLPIFPEMTDEELARTAEVILKNCQ